MMCKDCIHVEVCREYVTGLAIARGVELNETELEQVLVCDDCEHCADRSRFVELTQSLKIGDEVWCVLEDLDDLSLEDYKYTVGNNAVSDIPQVVTEIGEHGFWIDPIGNGFKPEWNEFYRWDEFGKTVFLTREEAEQALKEREKT